MAISSPGMRRIRTLLVDDRVSVRVALRTYFGSEADFEVVGEAENGKEGLALAHRLRPDVLVTDNSMPEMTGMELTATLAQQLPKVCIVMFSAEDADRPRAVAAGASAFVRKDRPVSELVDTIRSLACVRQKLALLEGSS